MNPLLYLVWGFCALCAFVVICAVIAGARADRFSEHLRDDLTDADRLTDDGLVDVMRSLEGVHSEAGPIHTVGDNR